MVHGWRGFRSVCVVLLFQLGLVTQFVNSNVSLAEDQPWNQFRGPRGDGRSTEIGLPVTWSEGSDNIRWKTAIHGKGWSSPVVWEDDIWLTTATEDGTRLYAVCVDRESGRVTRDVLVFEVDEPQFCHPTNSYASCTPLIDGDRVYVHFGRYGTACLKRATGETLWSRRDLPYDDFRGPASSPIVHGDLLFFSCDGVDVQYVVALNKHTGQTVWKSDRNIDYGTDNGDRKKAYGTPAIVTHDGVTQLVSPSASETIAYQPLTGDVMWRVRHGGMNAAARPVFGHGLIYISAGDGNYGLVAVRPNGSGDVTESRMAWNSGQSIPKRSSQILDGNLLFMVDDAGVASCLDALTGKTVWRHRFGGAYWGSPVYADGLIYFGSKEGRMPVIRASGEFELVADNQLDAGMNASPAVAGSSLIVRTFTHLYRIDGPRSDR